jgi:hypothetical protein
MDLAKPPETRPLLFRLLPSADNAIAMVLLTQLVALQIRKDRIKVSTSHHSYKRYATSVMVQVTTVDLDSDGQPDLAVYVETESVPNCNPDRDLCGGRRVAIGALHQGVWYVTGRTWPGQDRLEGF